MLLKKSRCCSNSYKKSHQRVIQEGNLQSIIELKRKDDQAVDKTVYFWDYYYSRLILKDSIPVIEHTYLGEYFPFKQTIRRMLALFGELFGLAFEEINGNVWSNDVE